MALTDEEKLELKQEILDDIKASSEGADELETVDTLDGVTSLPALKDKQLVSVPIEQLRKPAEDAAELAKKAATAATEAATNANAAAEAAAPAIENAKTAAMGANSAASAASNALESIMDFVNAYVTKESLEDKEIELLKRIQGTSENSDAKKDPFKFLGEFKDITALVTELDKMTEPNKGYVGIFRATISLRVITIINNPISAGDNAYNQMIIGNFRIGDNGKLEVHGQSNNILYRISYNSSWGDWQIANSTIIQGMIDGSSSAMRVELLERIQGTSENSNPRTDPFKYLGNFSDVNSNDLKSALDALHSTVPSDNIEGLYRATLTYAVLEIQCIAIEYANDRWMQILKSPYRWAKSAGKFDISQDPRYRILYRFHENNAWGDWRDTEQEIQDIANANTQLINNEVSRAQKEEAAIRKLITDLIGESPKTLDTIHEISSWILNDKTGAAAMATKINNLNGVAESLAEALNEEVIRATEVEDDIQNKALQVNTFTVDSVYDDHVNLYMRTLSGETRIEPIPAATTETAGVMSASDKKAFNNPLGLSTTIGIEEFIAFCLPDNVPHEIGVRQITFDNGYFKMFDATLSKDIGFTDDLAVPNPTGIREYWCKVAHDGKYYVYYARINWDIVKEVSWIKDVTQITEFFTLQPAVPVALSVAGSSLLNMLQSLDYDITKVKEYNSDGIAKELSVVWRDGTPGTVTYSDYRADVLEYGTLAVTYDKNEDPEKNHVKVVQVREYSEMGDVIKRTTTIKNA